jgi:rare lipoprotein A
MLRYVLLAAVAFGLAACADKSSGLPTSGVYKVGKPYQVKGVWYYPQEDFNYDETGIASWYGPGFHTKTTANGEIYDENELTAAHKTLQMPALVRVTNLDNGRSVVVRLNDRGPYYPGRIIDMSRRGAQLLGFEGKGTAKVRVQVLGDESRAIAAAARQGTPANLQASLDPAAAGAAPKAAPRPKVEISGGGVPAAPAAGAPSVLAAPVAPPTTVPGDMVGGRFLPSEQVQQKPLRPGHDNIYVQAGAFAVADNANRLRGQLSAYGPAHVSEATVGGRRFYRVRIGPMASVDAADAALDKVIQTGQQGARIIVD